MYKRRAILLILSVATLLAPAARSQSLRTYENLVTAEQLQSTVEYLAHGMTQGRASGTPGKELAEHYLIEQFRSIGLVPWNWSYTQSFSYQIRPN